MVQSVAQHGPLLLQVAKLGENTELSQPNLVVFSFLSLFWLIIMQIKYTD